MAKVNVEQMRGMIAQLDGNDKTFESSLQTAVSLENDTSFPAGPPRITKPSFEQYGEWLLSKGRYAEAEKQFDNSLSRMPNRYKAVQGKKSAQEALLAARR